MKRYILLVCLIIILVSHPERVLAQVPQKTGFQVDTIFKSKSLFNLNPGPGLGSPPGLIRQIRIEMPAMLKSDLIMVSQFGIKESFTNNPGILSLTPSHYVFKNHDDSISFKGSWSAGNIRDNFIFRLDYSRYTNCSFYKNPAIQNTNFYRSFFDNLWGNTITDIYYGAKKRR
jgi:hypothetical protein